MASRSIRRSWQRFGCESHFAKRLGVARVEVYGPAVEFVAERVPDDERLFGVLGSVAARLVPCNRLSSDCGWGS